MKIVDTKGQLCPAPLIATKRALKETAIGEPFIVLTDNRSSFNNLIRFLKDNNTEYSITEDEEIWSITITKKNNQISHPETNEYCSPEIAHFKKGDFIIVVGTDKMGEGNDKLGRLLMVNFIKAIKDLDLLPAKMIFYNKGVTLLVNDSPVFKDMNDLNTMGVEILLCATCVDYYAIRDMISIGILSNMFTLTELMVSAGKIIKP